MPVQMAMLKQLAYSLIAVVEQCEHLKHLPDAHVGSTIPPHMEAFVMVKRASFVVFMTC